MREEEGDAGDAMGSLLFGPGERLTDLMNLVSVTAPGQSVRQLADLDELAEDMSGSGDLLVDADVLPAEDVGYLRRFVARHGAFALTLIGEDSSRRVARTLLRLPRVRWMHWPPDLDDLRSLAEPARPAVRARVAAPPLRYPESAPATAPVQRAGAESLRAAAESLRAAAESQRAAVESQRAAAERSESRARSGGESSSSARPADDELLEIEAILDMPGDAETIPARPREARGASSRAGGSPVSPVASAAAASPAPYFRDQVADLADIAQRIEGSLAAVQESGSVSGSVGEELADDVARLLQFTRTLSYLSAPPPRGDQLFDLSELLDTLVDALPRKGPGSPRWLVRSDGPLNVRSDREVLLQAFDALLFVADKCSGKGDVVRVQAGAVERQTPPRARVTIEFAQGPLAGLDPAQVIAPYGLRRILPELGPNALSAAAGIAAGQGGRLDLRPARNRLTWVVEIPLAVAAATEAS